MSSFDTIVIGGGLSGLILTHLFHKEGHNVTLLEAREALGGRFRRPQPQLPYASSNLDFIPAVQEQLAALEWLRTVSPLSLTWKVQDHQALAMSEGQWKPFLGFGQSDHLSLTELSFFNQPSEVILDQGLEQVVRSLCEQLPVAAQTRNEVLSFNVADGRVTSCLVNGDKTLEASNFVFCPPPQHLNSMFNGDDLPAKHRTRLAKSVAWTVLVLGLEHQNELQGGSEIRFLLSGAKDFEPVVGRSRGKTSKWMILIDAEKAEDHEYIGSCIKHIKRLVKRAYPESDPLLKENIYVQPNGFGHINLKTKSPVMFSELSNLYLAHHGLSSLSGNMACVHSAQCVWNEFKGVDQVLSQVEPG